MDVTKILEADHREVEELLARIKNADGVERDELIDQMAATVLAHMELEERVLFPVMEDVTGPEVVKEAFRENDATRGVILDLVALSRDEADIETALDAFDAAPTHHVNDEETEVFPKMRAEGQDVLEQVATPFMETRLELDMDGDG